MKFRSKVLCAALLAAAFGAHAQGKPGGVYGELSYAKVKYKEAGLSVSPDVLRATIGTDLNPNLAIEGSFGVGIKSDSTRVYGVNVTGEIDNMFGVYVRPKVAVTPELELYGRLGVTRAEVSASVPGMSVSDSGSDFSYGLGLSYRVTSQAAATLDYMNYYSKDGVKVNGVAVGVRFTF